MFQVRVRSSAFIGGCEGFFKSVRELVRAGGSFISAFDAAEQSNYFVYFPAFNKSADTLRVAVAPALKYGAFYHAVFDVDSDEFRADSAARLIFVNQAEPPV